MTRCMMDNTRIQDEAQCSDRPLWRPAIDPILADEVRREGART